MSLEATRWTTTHVAPTRNSPFAGLGAGETTPSAGGVTPTGGVALVILGLGLYALWSEIRKGPSTASSYRWP